MAVNGGSNMKPKWWLALLGVFLILTGAFYANLIRSSDGVSVRDIRFKGTNGTVMSALLYVPASAKIGAPAPGILAVHGYINSRETQDGFSIEFARRGYVVLAIDQTGHGYSGGAAFSNGFGGPDGLKYLRSLPMVDKNQIGLEGHSMGGWTVLAAAAAMPDAYQSIVLEGSSTGAPFAKEGSATWPRNLALVFSRYDEFSNIMWGVDRANDVAGSTKLKALFGTSANVAPGRIYGSIADGSARILHQPATTHPGTHFSSEAIGHATDWFAKTLKGGRPLPSNDQRWFGKEIGTAIGLIGFVMVVLGAFDWLSRLPAFKPKWGEAVPAMNRRDGTWWRDFLLNAFLPALLFFPAFVTIYLLVPSSAIFPQMVTTQVTFWALMGALITLLINRLSRASMPKDMVRWIPSIIVAILTSMLAYSLFFMSDAVFNTDLRFWIIALKLPNLRQLGISTIYVVPLTIAYSVMLQTLCRKQTVRGDTTTALYLWAILSLTLGFIILFGSVYAGFFTSGYLITSFDPLSTVIGLQFIPILAAIAIIGIFTWRRTGSHRPGAALVGMLVTLYVVAGTATQFA